MKAGLFVSGALAWFDELIDEADEIHNNSFMTQDGFKKDSANLDGNPNHVGVGVPEGGQFTFAAGSVGAKTKEAASAKFPDEKWVKKAKGVYVAESRGKKKDGSISKQEKAKLEKEVEQASMLAKKGHIIFLTPEITPKNVKPFDGFIDGNHTLELKTVTGNIKTTGAEFKDAVSKAERPFIYTTNEFSKHEIYVKFRGELKMMKNAGSEIKGKSVYVKIKDSDIYEMSIESLLK